MTRFRSILFDGPEEPQLAREAPPSFADLSLDQVLAALIAGREEYELAPLFWTPLTDVAAVEYRHDVKRDLERAEVRDAVLAFGASMREMRAQLAEARKAHYDLQQQRWFLDAVDAYCACVVALREGLGGLELGSKGLRELRAFLDTYASGESFTSLVAETRRLTAGLAQVRYTVDIHGSRVRVDRYHDQADYGAAVQAAFRRFAQGEARRHPLRIASSSELNHVEAQVLALVARLHPDVFEPLRAFRAERAGYLDETVARFDREVQLYLAYGEYADRLRSRGLPFSYPRVSGESKETSATATFDVALATKLAAEGSKVVLNDLSLTGEERALVVTGPNQGGKTTFARTFGQLHYLASLGLPVAGRDVRLLLPDRVFTHFAREEDIGTLRGRLEDELVRMQAILEAATDRSVLVLNESFTSTALQDTIVIGGEVLERIRRLDLLCVYVTFVDELASANETIVSMVSTVVPDDPATRTFRIERRPADGLAYAAAIARKHGLSYEHLRARVTT